MFQIKFVPGEVLESSRPIYRSSDTSLYFRSNEKIQNCFYAIADTLTITFDSSTGKFIGFDSYTSSEKWVKRSIELPSNIEHGLIYINIPTEDDRIDFDLKPIYEFDVRNRCLRIRLCEKECEKYFKTANGLLVGVLESSALNEIFIFDLEIE